MNRYFASLLFTGSIITTSLCQKIATFEVEVSGPTLGLDEPASIDLDAITFLPDSVLTLVENIGKRKVSVPFQIETKSSRTLHWIVKADDKIKKHVYELVKGSNPTSTATMKAKVDDGMLTLGIKDKKLLRYNFKTIYPPSGIDTAFKRSGFIHPLWTPHGQVLTRIQAPDHYHHYGIWNPWTHVLFEGDTVDFWNLKDKKGTVRFSKFVSVVEGDLYSEFSALHEHVAFKKDGRKKVALNELQTVRIYRPSENQDYYYVDIAIQLNCASASPFKILQYRYAGLGWRATEKWNEENSEVLTSENKTRIDADESRARWFMIQGNLDLDFGGAVMMSHPANYNHPEPLRIWPHGYQDGRVFAMFAPTKTTDWLLLPGETYTLRYRFIVFNGHFSKEKAERGWSHYSTPSKVSIKTIVK